MILFILRRKSLKRISFLIIAFTLISFSAFPQNGRDTTLPYIPQISIAAVNGFGPYVLGSNQENVFLAYDLPDKTTKVTFRFLDVDSVQIGHAYTDETPAITLSYWFLNLDSMNLTLSPQLNVEVTYKGDSIANYYIAYKVHPDTVKFEATAGFGPFITNEYFFSSPHWNQVPELYNTFSVKNLPPRTSTVKFYIMSVDTTIIDSLIVNARRDQYLDSASYPNIRMDMLPLSTRFLKTRIVCSGSPKGGLEYHNTLKIIPQKPYLLFRSEGTGLTDSLGVAVQNQLAGHVLSIDSVKYAEVTNRPGVYWDPIWYAKYRGPYSIDLFKDNFSIEAWIQMDVNKLNNTEGIMRFMSVDSVWALSIKNNPSSESVRFIISTLFNPDETILHADTIIYYADVNYSLLQEPGWHHIAFAIDGNFIPSYVTCDFYFDGNPGLSHISDLTWYIEYEYYTYWLGTQELYIGGGHPSNRKSRSNPSFITAIDEVRIWKKKLSAQEVKENFSKIILQDNALIGYWNFNNVNERKGIIQDISYKNNPGTLYKGAIETPQYPRSQETIDSIRVYSSNFYTDSVQFSFIDHYNNVLDSVILIPFHHHSTLIYDVSALPYTASKLRIKEYFPGNEDEGFSTDYALNILAPTPLASSLQGWNQYYPCSDTGVQYISDTGFIFNTVLVSGLPQNTKKVILGLKKDEEEYDTISYLENCVPYHHSLTLNGIDNYIETIQTQHAPSQSFSIMLWFNTTTTKGGEMLRYYDIEIDDFGPFIRMKTDGALEFGLPTNGGVDTVLHASSKFNDGAWHCVVGTYDGHYINNRATLYVDGCIVDENNNVEGVAGILHAKLYMGRTFENIIVERDRTDTIADYFEGSLSEVSLWRWVLDYKSINKQMFKPVKALGSSGDNFGYYKFDENTGTLVHDYSYGVNATLHGSSQNWFKSNGISKLAWNCNMLDKAPGDYTFFSKVFYDGGPDTGVYYPLGKFFIEDPVPGYTLAYRLSEGQGYFDEGTIIENKFELWTNYNRSDISCDSNRIILSVIDVDHNIVDKKILVYTTDTTSFSFTFDMGDLIPGTYISLVFANYRKYYGWNDDYELLLPVLTRPMIPPKVTGNFGPFDRAIAPGTMVQENTFTITTEVYDDLKEIIVRFNKLSGEEIDTIHPKKVNETTWLLTYDMAKLSPPVTLMKIEYYLGNNPKPALIQGPLAITIHETRPKWFDFVPDEGFSDISETQDNVTFTISTTLGENDDVCNTAKLTAPDAIPLIGGCSSSISTPIAKVDLTYNKPEYKLTIVEDPKLKPEVTNFGGGNATTLNMSFHTSGDHYFRLDDNNDLFAVQNFSVGGSFTTGFQNAIKDTYEGVKELITLAEAADPATLIISPSFSFFITGGFQYSSRLNLQVDSATGKWGSVGELKVNATDIGSNAYKNSASFHFYSGDIGAEFDIGVKLLVGLVEADFCTTLRFDLGFGHSWVSIPAYKKRNLKSFGFDVYGKAIVMVFWGWYTETVWGPQMFYSTTLWGDNLQGLFPEIEKKSIENISIPVNSSWPELTREVKAVGVFSKLPVAYPQQKILWSNKGSLFTWLERGKNHGKRALKTSFFDKESRKFGDQHTIALNNNAINTPDAAMMNDSTIIYTWAQTRHTNNTILEVKSFDVIREFALSQDICYAVYDMKADSILQSGTMEDDFLSFVSGRAEGNPEIISIAENRALVIWMVADLETNNSYIWYSLLEKQGESWITTPPAIATEIFGIQTDLEIESPEENQAVMIWINTNSEDQKDNRLMTTTFNGESWTIPGEIYSKDDGFFHNDLDMDFTDGQGAAVWTTYVKDSLNNIYETLSVLPWDHVGDCWSEETPLNVFTDSICHVQHPRIEINSDGTAVIAMKVEKLFIKANSEAISRVDLLIGDINNPLSPWIHIPANEYVCDTTKQVANLDFTFAGKDTLILLSHEYVMLPTNSPFKPQNGIIFGDPYMNLVLRSFAIDESGMVSDINEEEYFVRVEDYEKDLSGTELFQNFPNPCSDQTRIRFYISESVPVKLELFYMNGLKVADMIDQEMLQGTYEMTLNTSLLKPGTYICVLTADNVLRTIKIIVGK